MKPGINVYSIRLIFLLLSLHVHAQRAAVLETGRMLDTLLKDRPLEKLFVHLDKFSYIPGDTLWYKVYAMDGLSREPSRISGVVYVELLDGQGKLVGLTRQALLVGSAYGCFVLDTARSRPGRYQLRAYTRWLQNFGPAYYFRQSLLVMGSRPEEPEKKPARADDDVQFLPESGHWLAGLPQVMGVKALDPAGRGVPIRGSIEDESGQEVATFEAAHQGMGRIALPALKAGQYQSRIHFADGSEKTYKLPAMEAEGISLSYEQEGDSLVHLRIRSSTGFRSRHSKVLLLGQTRGVLSYGAVIGLNKPEEETSIARSGFTEGIAHFSLLDRSGRPLAERMVYNRHGKPGSALNLSGRPTAFATAYCCTSGSRRPGSCFFAVTFPRISKTLLKT